MSDIHCDVDVDVPIDDAMRINGAIALDADIGSHAMV